MKPTRTLALAATLLAVFTTQGPAREVGGVALPERLKAGEKTLRLNGAGVREKFFMDLYVGGLYLKEADANARRIINADEPMAIRLHIISSMITSERMEDATREGFENSTGGNTAPIREEIEAFIDVFRSEIEIGDVYDLVYQPGRGVEVFKNGKSVSLTEGLPLKRALFGIWLCDQPAQEDLKEAMLGN